MGVSIMNAAEIIGEQITQYVSLLPYWSFVFGAAYSFYRFMLWLGGHFKEDLKKDLTDWLTGKYECTWASQFCRLFDTAFGERHNSTKRITRSAIASVLAVIFLYVFFAHILGVLGSRTFGTLSLWQALLIGAAINIIPDYISLIETRWLLEKFTQVKSVIGQLLLLFIDVCFSAVIIFIGIYIYSFLFLKTDDTPSFIEIIAFF